MNSSISIADLKKSISGTEVLEPLGGNGASCRVAACSWRCGKGFRGHRRWRRRDDHPQPGGGRQFGRGGPGQLAGGACSNSIQPATIAELGRLLISATQHGNAHGHASVTLLAESQEIIWDSDHGGHPPGRLRGGRGGWPKIHIRVTIVRDAAEEYAKRVREKNESETADVLPPQAKMTPTCLSFCPCSPVIQIGVIASRLLNFPES